MNGTRSFLEQNVGFIMPATVTLVVGIISATIAFLKDLGASNRRLRAIQEATSRIEFWEKYQKCLRDNDLPTFTAAQLSRGAVICIELDFAAQQVVRTRLSQLGNRKNVGPLRRFLMLYRINSPMSQSIKAALRVGIISFCLFSIAARFSSALDLPVRHLSSLVFWGSLLLSTLLLHAVGSYWANKGEAEFELLTSLIGKDQRNKRGANHE